MDGEQKSTSTSKDKDGLRISILLILALKQAKKVYFKIWNLSSQKNKKLFFAI